MRLCAAPHPVPPPKGEGGAGLVTGALVAGGVWGLSAPRRLAAPSPEDIWTSVKEAGRCLRF